MCEETAASEGKPPEPEPQTAATPAPLPGTDGSVDPVKRGQTWATVAHLAALAGYLGVPLGYVLGPLVVWLTTKDKYRFADDQGKEALNFQLTVLVCTLACLPLLCLCVGALLMAALHVFNLVLIIVAAIRTSNGEAYRYPICIRFLR